MEKIPAGSSDFSAYGASGATGQFDPVKFIKKPEVILRIIGWVFSIVVFGCISSQGWERGDCLYNGDSGACGFGTFVGVLAFILLLLFLALDAKFDNISNANHRRYIVITDIALSGILGFFWFVCFCYLTDAHRKTDYSSSFGHHASAHKSGLEAAIAFSFFEIVIFGALTVLAILRYRRGIPDGGAVGYDQQPYNDPSASPF